MNEQKFVNIAVCEVDFPTTGDYYNPNNVAMFKLSGCIGQTAKDKEEFLCAGETFLDLFEENARFKIQDEEFSSACDQERIDALQRLIDESKMVDLDIFLSLLGEDWDERDEQEED